MRSGMTADLADKGRGDLASKVGEEGSVGDSGSENVESSNRQTKHNDINVKSVDRPSVSRRNA